MVQIIVDVRKRLVRRFAMQLCLNFNKRMVYSNTEQTVRDGDVVHLNNKPYFISEVDVDVSSRTSRSVRSCIIGEIKNYYF